VQQFLKVWSGLERRGQIIVVLATAAMFVAILAMSRMAAAPSMTLLYAGLESGAAGDVVQSLEQRGVVYEVRGGSIFVDSSQRDELRLTLASEGLPANSNRGYELLDQLTGFGTTSQMFDAAYWRAKEGELARTIVSSPHVAMARVHIATTGSNPFQRGVTPKASVFITPNGSDVTGAQAKAVRFLVASAVSGLSADDVAVIDSNGALIGSTDAAPPAIGGDDKAQVLRDRVQRLLEATVASNLPDQGNGAGTGSGSSQNAETRERINYEVSEIEREVVRAPGAIKRVTVAVLVNDASTTDAQGTVTTTARDPTELEALRELVSSAVGFDEARGDIITIKSMTLLSVPAVGTAAAGGMLSQVNLDIMSLIQMAVLAIVTLVLGLFVVRPLLSRPAVGELPGPDPIALGPADDIPTFPVADALSGEIETNSFDLPDLNMTPGFDDSMLPDLPAIGAMGGSADPVERLRGMIGERQEETVEILRSWLEDEEESV